VVQVPRRRGRRDPRTSTPGPRSAPGAPGPHMRLDAGKRRITLEPP